MLIGFHFLVEIDMRAWFFFFCEKGRAGRVKKTKENGGKSHFGKTLPFLRLTEKNQIVAIGTLQTTENHSGVG